ncbi:MAG: DUF2027 domain-containing protein [Paludibacter sp.]|jgi:hypothetical protein|nr:DUF2027 domain-containing protein [Paludibacter sp.]
MKTGDTVRFLNDVGGGVITRVDAKNQIVYVADNDGFEIPVLANHCVVVAEVNPDTNIIKKDFGGKTSVNSVENPKLEEKIPIEKKAVETILETPEGDNLAVFLAFIPHNIKQLQTTDCDCILVNDSNYYLFYNLVLGDVQHCKSVASGIIEPNTFEELLTVAKTELNDWEKTRIQIVAYKNAKKYVCQKAIDTPVSLDLTKFYKLHCFIENDYFDQAAMLIDVMAESQKRVLKNISPNAIKEAIASKQIVDEKVISKTSKPDNSPLEIDLHINQLLDNTAGMTNAEMLVYQLDTVKNTLNNNRNFKGKKIVFIHGKGDGVLRNEIEKLLKLQYRNYGVQDASFRQYGFGATMVTVR